MADSDTDHVYSPECMGCPIQDSEGYGLLSMHYMLRNPLRRNNRDREIREEARSGGRPQVYPSGFAPGHSWVPQRAE